MAGCLLVAAFTRHAWEDYYITFRSSLNLAQGHGLVYQAGERVHTFTSPLGTLLPALFALGGGGDPASRALWCFRLASAFMLAGAIWMAATQMVRGRMHAFAIVTACSLWVLDAKTLDFAINGMESAFVVFFVIVTWRAVTEGTRVWPCAIGLAGLQWTRPDGAVFFAALALAQIALGSAGATGRFTRLGVMARGAALGLVLYLPWVGFAWFYYGTPLPHTVIAKVAHHAPGQLLPALVWYPWRLLFGHTALHDVFLPAYHYFGGWPEVLRWIARGLAVGAAIAWLIPGVRPAGRIASLAFFLGGFYVEYIPRSPWYYPGWEALGFIGWAYLLDAGLRTGRPVVSSTLRIGGAAAVLCWAGVLGAVALQLRAQQSIIEDGNRREIGRWLRTHAGAGDRVYLEPLGYIGYFSGLKMLDYPGLASPEVVAARRAGARPHAGIIALLRPEWLVLRPDQLASVQADAPDLLREQYRLARLFDQRAAIDARGFLPGRGYLEFDAVYYVFRRISPAEAAR